MKNLLTFAKIFGVVALVPIITSCSSTTSSSSTTSTASQKEAWLIQGGFKAKTVTTSTQQQLVAKLPMNKVSAVTYKKTLVMFYPTGKNTILVGRQAQLTACRQLLETKHTQVQAKPANQRTPQEQQMLDGYAEWSGETVGPRHMQVTTFDGFGPLDPDAGRLSPLGIFVNCLVVARPDHGRAICQAGLQHS